MSDITHILAKIESGDTHAAEQLLPLVYDELRKLAAAKLAREKPGQTLQATALVHEAYLRLVDAERAQQWDSRGHFFGAAAEAMRRILIDRARRKQRPRHGGDRQRVDFDSGFAAADAAPDTLLAMDEALQRFAEEDPSKAALVKLRYFAGLRLSEAAEVLGISDATAKRYWAYLLLGSPDDASQVEGLVADMLHDKSPFLRRHALLPMCFTGSRVKIKECAMAEPKVVPGLWNDAACLSYMADETSETQLLELAGEDYVSLANAYFTIAMLRLADGNEAEAIEYFEKCVATNATGFFDCEWARAYLSRMKSGAIDK